MNGPFVLPRWFFYVLLGLVACNMLSGPWGTSPTPAALSPLTGSSPAAPSVTAAPQSQPAHRLGVRQVNGVGEIYDKQTGVKFVPRGANYVFVPQGSFHTLWLLKVGIYDPQRTRVDFARLAGLGYNTVRVFLDQCNKGEGCIGDGDNQGLNPAYLDNIADMMAAAREAGIYIFFTSNDLPDQGGYAEEANSGSGAEFGGYRNSYYLRPQAVNATRRYWNDLFTGLAARRAAFEAVLGWELLNEQWMFRDQPPLSLSSGAVQTTTGTYDMSDAAQKRRMVSDGLVYYIAQMKAEILRHDPEALVAMGFFAPEIAAPDWYVDTAPLLQKSDLDVFDFHAYPGGPSLRDHAEHFGMLGYDARPILMGEYGAFRSVYPDPDFAARAVTDWVAESCQYGFDGWLYWTYYPGDASAGDQTWGLVDENDRLLNLLAPKNQPDPCTAAQVPVSNLAYDKPAAASRSLPDQPPGNAVDENGTSAWSAGDGPPQWIQIDLQGSYRITEIRLLVAQYPDGNTAHDLQISLSTGGGFESVHKFQGATKDNDWLVFKPDAPLEDVSLIRVQTLASPSWVAWKEIDVYGQAMQP